jgi:PKHD-type hydroxylase
MRLSPIPELFNVQQYEGWGWMMQEKTDSFTDALMWKTYRYCDVYNEQFDDPECEKIIELHHEYSEIPTRVIRAGTVIRDSDIFWIPRAGKTEWVFSRLWNLVKFYNAKYAFELSGDMGQAQLTRYSAGQRYNWHMDIGPREASLRKISVVVELTSLAPIDGGGIEIFYGDSVDNKIQLNRGDVVVFPSFVMHRASPVRRGVRWSLVLWIKGTQPLR